MMLDGALTEQGTLTLPRPHLLFLGDATNPLDAKTAMGLRDWRREDCLGQLRLPGCTVDLGLPEFDLERARAAGARSVVVGVAPSGGAIAPGWIPTLCRALELGLSVVGGLHDRLADSPELAEAARNYQAQLIDVRVPPAGLSVATGARRSGKRLLTVGTDCCVGKKYTALALTRALRKAGASATYRATGQTGILIAGEGIPMDAVVADFLSGAAELLSPANDADHWDVIEGQGALFHPAYAAVTLGLIHGSQPDALILCHSAGRRVVDEYEAYDIPALSYCIQHYEAAAALTNPAARVVGISLNTRDLDDAAAEASCKVLQRDTGLPCLDPMRHDPAPLVNALL